MRIVTFNIRHGLSPNGQVDTSALAAYCAGLEPDVLALQEVDVGTRRSGGSDQAAAVAAAAGLESVFGRACRVGVLGSYGNALLVRGVTADVEEIRLPRIGRHEPRAAIVAGVQLHNMPVSVAVTHLSVDPVESHRQLAVVLRALSERPLPRLLLGDLNLTADAVVDAVVASGLSLADTTAPTFPSAAPRARIDHVAVAGLQVLSVEVPEAPVSDHRPLVVEVRAG